jgi:TolB-like protein
MLAISKIDKEATMTKHICCLLSSFIIVIAVLQVPQSFCSEASPPPYLEPMKLQEPIENSGNECNLVTQIRVLAEELFVNLEDPDPQIGDLGDGMLVTTFVDINKLYRTSSFGRYLAEQIMNEFQSHAYKVIDMRKSLSVVVQEKRGEFGLSRNSDEIGANASAGAMLTGTYLIGKDDIIVNARILDNKSSVLLSSSTVIFEKNPLTEQMLQDAATVKTKQADVTYLKKLEM